MMTKTQEMSFARKSWHTPSNFFPKFAFPQKYVIFNYGAAHLLPRSLKINIFSVSFAISVVY